MTQAVDNDVIATGLAQIEGFDSDALAGNAYTITGDTYVGAKALENGLEANWPANVGAQGQSYPACLFAHYCCALRARFLFVDHPKWTGKKPAQPRAQPVPPVFPVVAVTRLFKPHFCSC